MSLCHASQDTLSRAGSVTLRLFPVGLLLLVSLLESSSTCHFENAISTTFNRHIKTLSKWLLLDYPISVTSNLKPDSWCSELWQLQLMKVELERMKDVAGEDLTAELTKVWREIAFLSCYSFTVSTDCLVAERTNVSNFLTLLEQQINVLKGKLTGQNELDFSNCTQILCIPAMKRSTVEKPSSDSMTMARLSLPPNETSSRQEDHQANTASRTTPTWRRMSSIMGARQRRTPEENTSNMAVLGSKDWHRRVQVWLITPIIFLTFIMLVLAGWSFRSSRKKWNSVTLELEPLP